MNHGFTLFAASPSHRWCLALAASLLLAGPGGLRADEGSDVIKRGAGIYASQCAQCHGDQGQGVADFYSDPLVGDSTIGELAELISDTMPEEDPDACVAQDAQAVATFIHHEFYSEAAQVRRRPARVTLSRLTGEQLRQSLADLYGNFQGNAWTTDERGAKGMYFNGSRWKKEELKIERTDAVLDFDFANDSPGEGISAEEFFIQWTGSLKVNRSGRYEIVARSSCSFRMNFGAQGRQLIDNHVQSEGKEEFRRTVELTAGRCYPFSVDFVQRKRKTEQPPARFSLSWVPPGGVEEPIPTDAMLPSMFPSTFALQSKLPPDDRSYGYDRGTAINRSWEDSTTAAAIEFAQIAASELFPEYLRRHKKDSDENRGKLRGFLGELVETAFRGPLDDSLRSLYVDSQVDRCPDDAEAIKQTVLMTLKSPRFLYPTLDSNQPASRRVANRLALVLFDSLPSDDWLTKAAEKGQLTSRKPIEGLAWKMVGDYRCEAKMRALIYQWFHLDKKPEEITKDGDAFPGFDGALVADLRRSLDRQISDVLGTENSDFRQLLQADWCYTTERMAEFYGPAWAPAEPFSATDSMVRSVADPVRHVGLLTHPLLMSDLAYNRATSPIHRGVFLVRHAMGRVLRPPNAAFTPLNPELHPDMTTRQRVELQTGEVSCQVCHSKINPLGFALENFDAAGRYREMENGKAVDATGRYVTRSGREVTFTGARELAEFMASSEDTHRSFVETAFEYFVKQPIAAFGPELSDELTRSFQDSGCNIRQLIVAIAIRVAESTVQQLPDA